jgi:Flp pilus assembly pilin Flp
MEETIVGFFRDDCGQDLAEYCLLTALVALLALGIFWRMSGGIDDLWGTANTTLSTGNQAGTPSPAGATIAPNPAHPGQSR